MMDENCQHWWIVVAVLVLMLARKDVWRLLCWWTGRPLPPVDPDNHS